MHSCLYVCDVCMLVCVHVCMREVHSCTWVDLWYLFHFSPYLLRPNLFTEPEACLCSWIGWLVSLQDPLILRLSVLRF